MRRLTKFQGTSAADRIQIDFLSEPGAIVALYMIVLAIALYPIATVEIPPLADLPNHLARIYILANLDSNADLQKFYTVRWHPIFFQSTDILLPPLARSFGLFAAARLYIATAFILLMGATAFLHRVLFGYVGLWPAVASLFLYNYSLSWGFISYQLAMGLVLLLFAAWVATEKRPGWGHKVAFGVGALLLFFAHFFAFIAYFLMVLSYELAGSESNSGAKPALVSKERLRHLTEASGQFVLPGLLFLCALPTIESSVTQYGSMTVKIGALLSPMLTYGGRIDRVLIIAVLVSWSFLRWSRRISFARSMRFVAAALILAAVLAPSRLSGVWGADLRLPCLLAFLLIASTDLSVARPRSAAMYGLGLIALLVVRVGWINEDWQRYAADFAEFRRGAEVIEKGSRVLVIPAQHDFRPTSAPSLYPYYHVAALAVIDRDVFLPRLFTVGTPLGFRRDLDVSSNQLARQRRVSWRPKTPAFQLASTEAVRQAEIVGQFISDTDYYTSRIDWSDWPEEFDYLVDLNFGQSRNPAPALLTEVARGSYFAIFRIHPPQTP